MEAEKNENQKGGRIEGGLVDEDVLESSDSILQKTGYNGTKGAQQYYSPPELSSLLKSVMGNSINILDPMAGDGSLLQAFDFGHRWGIEIDKDQPKAAQEANRNYHSIVGDFQHVYDLLRKGGVQFDGIVCNPPFDLRWSEPSIEEGEEMSSTKLAFLTMLRLGSHNGQYAFICGRDRWDREIADLPEAETHYAILDVEDLFPDVSIPCVVVFGIFDTDNFHYRWKNGGEENGPQRRKATRDTLDILEQWVKETRHTALGYSRLASYANNNRQLEEFWPAAQKEYDQRKKERLGKYERKYDFELGPKGNTLKVAIGAYAKIILSQKGDLTTLERMHNHNLNYFRQNEAAWRMVVEAAEDGLISVQPDLFIRVEELLSDNRRISAPLYGLKEVQSLGYLDQIDRLLCIKTNKEKGFYQGERYSITVRPVAFERKEKRFEANQKTGEWQEKHFLQQLMRLRIQIANDKGHYQNFHDDDGSQDDIQFLIDHFDIKPPKDIAELFPEEVHAMRSLIHDIEWDTIIPNSARYLDDPEINAALDEGVLEVVYDFETEGGGSKPLGVRLRHFQREDLARGLVKGNFICAWEQGLGKTLAALVWAEANRRLGRSNEQNLFIVPGDLVPQWQRECERFMGRKMELIAPREKTIKNPNHGKVKRARKEIKHTVPVQAVAADVARRMKKGETGWFVTYHEALSVIGTKNSRLPDELVQELPQPDRWVPGKYAVAENGAYEYIEGYNEPQPNLKLFTNELCLQCEAGLRDGYDGTNCSKCGYSHTKERVKPAGSYLTTAFQRGNIIVDEITMIGCAASGQESLRSKTVRGLRSANKLGMTGTPIKNYITQLYWILRWVIDNERFGYSWGSGGWNQFIKDFAVIEWDVSKGTKQNMKPRPQITNLSMLWKTLAASMIRRRQEETGEEIVDIFYHEHQVPLGTKQREQLQVWLKRFHELFKEKYPDSKVVRANMQEALAPMLGMKPKFQYALTCPEADPDFEWTGVPVSNYTPANLRVLELALKLAKEGRKVLVGSATKETGRWLADTLAEKGVNAVHILDDAGQTYSPKKRAEVVHSFQTDDVQVFCAGVQAIRLGHNLDAGSAVIIHGMPWDWETFAQFVFRVRRLTSKKNIDCHVVLPHGKQQTLTEKIWDLLQQKGQASELALDGRLIPKDMGRIDTDAIMKEIAEKGIQASGDEVPEKAIESIWKAMPMYEDYEPPANLKTTGKKISRPNIWAEMEDAWNAVTGRGQFLALPMVASPDSTGLVEEEGVDLEEETPMPDILASYPYEPNGAIAYVPAEQKAEDEITLPEIVQNETKFSDSPPEPDMAPTTSKTDIIAALRDLAGLKSEGILDDQEFAEAKAALLSQLKGST